MIFIFITKKKGKYWDNNYDLEKVNAGITHFGGSIQMANYLNKCDTCRPSIMDNIDEYLAGTAIVTKCVDCEKKCGPDGIQNIVCSTCGIKAISCCSNKIYYDKFGNVRRLLHDETERMTTKTHLENQMKKETYTIKTCAPNEREKKETCKKKKWKDNS